MLEVRGLAHAEGGIAYLAEIDATFAPGSLTTILGRTGAGKTSLLRAVAGLLQPDAGEVSLAGTSWTRLPPWKRPVAMVTQQFINYPHLSVLDNVAFPLVRAGQTWAAAREPARAVLSRVGLSAMTDRRPSQLSGGQQQRVAIARALVKRAPVLLLDEPFANLDYKLREGLREELIEMLRAEAGPVVLYATTEPREALSLGSRVLVMAEGRVLHQGRSTEVFGQPRSLDAARAVNDPPLNVVPVRLDGLADAGPFGRQDLGPLGAGLPSGDYSLGLRAGDIRPGGPHRATVVLSEVTGSETITHLDLGGLPLVMHERSVATYALHEEIAVAADLGRGLLFGRDGALVRGGAHG